MKPVMYIFMNRAANMTKGKFGAQTGHAASRAQEASDPELVECWKQAKHETKLIMLAEDEQHLLVIERYIRDRGFKTELIIDEGRTEVRPHTATALGVEVVDKDDLDVQACFGDFKVYRDSDAPPDTGREEFPSKKKWWNR